MKQLFTKKAQFTYPALLWAILVIGILTLLSILFLYFYTKPVSSDAVSPVQVQQRWLLVDAARTVNLQTNSLLYQYMDAPMSSRHIQQLDPLSVLLTQSQITCARIVIQSINLAPDIVALGGSNCQLSGANKIASYIILPNRFIQLEVQ